MVHSDTQTSDAMWPKSTIENIQDKAGFESKNWVGKTMILQVLKIAGKDCVIGAITTNGK